jgi:hypothetical protein
LSEGSQKDPEPDPYLVLKVQNPAGPKTYGSYESGSATIEKKSKQVFGNKLIESGYGLLVSPDGF